MISSCKPAKLLSMSLWPPADRSVVKTNSDIHNNKREEKLRKRARRYGDEREKIFHS
jgi:hypothetical protein